MLPSEEILVLWLMGQGWPTILITLYFEVLLCFAATFYSFAIFF